MDYQSLCDDELVRECAKDSDSDAWTEFRHRFHRTIASVATKACREWSISSPEVIEDLIQDTYTKVWKDERALLANFRPQHPNAFRGYLKKITANVVYDHFRAEHASKRNVANTVELNEA